MERFAVLQLLPAEGSFATLKIVRDLQNILAPNEEEFKEFEIVQEGEKVKWNSKGTEPKEIKLGEKATDVVKEALEKLDKDKKLKAQHMSIYEKFIKE